MLLDLIVQWILKRDNIISWAEYRLNHYLNRHIDTDISHYNEVSGILAEELHHITDQLGLKKRY